MQGIESAQENVDVSDALREADAVLQDLQQKVSIEDWEELYASQ